MNRFFKYWTSYFFYTIKSNFISGKKIKKQFAQRLYTVQIKNSKLAKELEEVCKKDGFLTYAQYLQISQYGANGYHGTHTYHGTTDVSLRWTKPILTLCQQEEYQYVVEFGCGDGELGVALAKEAKKQNIPFFWTGIDINQAILTKIPDRFRKQKIITMLRQTATKITDINLREKYLLLFPYSLDSIPPEMMINTSKKPSLPNAMIGVIVQNGMLSEIIPTKKQLEKKGIVITNKGIHYKKKYFDLSSWKLLPNQRAYIPITAYEALRECIQKIPRDSLFIILDEFASAITNEHLCLPKDLDKYPPTRSCDNIQKQYEESGKNILYFPSPLKEYIQIIKHQGIGTIFYAPEHDLAKNIAAWKNKFFNTYTLCYALLCKK